MKIVIAGASGFIGKKLCEEFLKEEKVTEVVGLSRFSKGNKNPLDEKQSPLKKEIIWRKADLMNLEESIEAVKGCTHAFYLVHSMSPQARFAQGNFEDFDLYQADNFARACAKNNIQSIFYLGGLAPYSENKSVDPDEETWSQHLRSRIEVETVLSGYGAKVTVFRAGLILGEGGSSSEMMLNLVRRLPLMIAPSWTRTLSEPVDVRDVIYALKQVTFNETLQGKTWDISAHEKLSYQHLMGLAAEALKLNRKILPVPFISPQISQLWVSLVSGSAPSLVYPLVESLIHPMLTRDEHRLFDVIQYRPFSVRESLKNVCEHSLRHKVNFKSVTAPWRSLPSSTVRSIQRFNFIHESGFKKLNQINQKYIEWLPKVLFGLLKIDKKDDFNEIWFKLRFTGIVLLKLKKDIRSEFSDIERFLVSGGVLQKSNTGGFLEFRKINSTLSIIFNVQDFSPRLPWYLYRWTQAMIHLLVMNLFGKKCLKTFDHDFN